MKATIKVLALLLVAVMMIGLFAGCNQTTTPTTNAPAGTTAGNAGNDGTTAAGTKELKKITVMVRNTTFGVDFDLNDFENTNIYPAYKALCEKYGLDITWQLVEEDQYKTAVTTTLAGGVDALPDIMFYSGGVDAQLIEAADAGMFLAIQDILEHSNGTAKAVYDSLPLYFAKNNLNGKTYWVGEYQEVWYQGRESGIGYGAPTGLNYREDFLAQLEGVAEPTTYETFKAYLLACQEKDVNHNGEVDEYLCVYVDKISRSSIQFFFGVPCQEFAIDLSTNKASTPWQHKNVREYLNALMELVDLGLIPADFIGAESGGSSMRAKNQCAAYAGYYCDNWSLASCPKYDGQTDFPNLIGIKPDTTVHPDAYLGHDAAPQIDVRVELFSAKCDIEAAARFLDMVTSDEYMHMLKWGTEGESFAYNAKGEEVYFEGSGDYAILLTNPMATTGRPLLSNGFVPELHKVFHAEEDEAICDTEAELKRYQDTFWWPVSYTNQPNAFMATPTAEETATLNALETEYLLLSSEIFMEIITGAIDINDDAQWATVIERLEEGGMLDILEVYQARHDRMIEAMNG